MKRTLSLALAILVLSVPAAAEYSYLSLFATAGHDIYAYCPKDGIYPIEMWIWSYAGSNGQICAEFSISYPLPIIQSTVTWNDPLVSVTLGDLATGVSVCYSECQHDWHWIAHQALWVIDPSPGIVQIAPHPETGECLIASCLEGYPVEPCFIWMSLYYNDPCPPGG